MKKQFLKEKHIYHNVHSFSKCEKECEKHCKHCTSGEYDRDHNVCICYEESDEQESNRIMFKIQNKKKYKINKIAFYVTFAFFMIVVLILIFFFIKIFFLTSN